MSKHNRVTHTSWAILFFLAIFFADAAADGAEPEEPADSTEAVIPATELDIQPGPLGTPRQLKRNPHLAPKGAVPSRGILQAASRPTATGRREADAHSDTVRAFLEGYRPYLRLDDPVAELKLERRFTDALQRTHFRYAQQYQGLPVWPATLNVHLDPQGNVDLMNGSYVPTTREVNIHPSIEEDRALVTARAKYPRASRRRSVIAS